MSAPTVAENSNPNLLPTGAARTTDPETSHMGAEDVTQRRVTQHLRLLRAYAYHPEGLTNYEAGRAAGMPTTSCYWKRCSELLANGFIEVLKDGTGKNVRRKVPTGSSQRVCAITDSGMSFLDG